MSGHGSATEMNGDGTEWFGASFVPTADTFTAPVDGWYSFGPHPPVFLGAERPVSAVDAHAIVIPAWVEVT